MKNLDLVILAGGKGTRIKKYLHNNPKPMVKFNEIFFLQYLINIYSQSQHSVPVGNTKEIRFTNWIKQVRPIASAAVLARDEENQIG